MTDSSRLPRRSFLIGTAAAATGLLARPAAAATTRQERTPEPLWCTAARNGLAYGTSWSTRLADDHRLTALLDREAKIALTEDDLLWYRLKPTPDARLDFSYGDRFYAHNTKSDRLVLGAHLVWDEGFGTGWTHKDLWGLDRRQASDLLFGVVRREVERYQGRTAAWVVANEVTGPDGHDGFRTDVPWYHTIGPHYVAEAFHLARDADPGAELILNDFGFETADKDDDMPVRRRRAFLQVLDTLLSDGAPVRAVGIQGHLRAYRFAARFDESAYREFLTEVADRGVHILVTELDVFDGGLPADPAVRDPAVADVYRRYLDVTLDEPAVKAVLTFGLTDRYSWLQEDYPRHDGAPRRPLPFDAMYRRKPAFWALRRALHCAPYRKPLWRLKP